MKRIIPFMVFACLTGITTMGELPVFAGSCSNHINKKAQIKCSGDEAKCKKDNTNKEKLDKTSFS